MTPNVLTSPYPVRILKPCRPCIGQPCVRCASCSERRTSFLSLVRWPRHGTHRQDGTSHPSVINTSVHSLHIYNLHTIMIEENQTRNVGVSSFLSPFPLGLPISTWTESPFFEIFFGAVKKWCLLLLALQFAPFDITCNGGKTAKDKTKRTRFHTWCNVCNINNTLECRYSRHAMTRERVCMHNMIIWHLV